MKRIYEEQRTSGVKNKRTSRARRGRPAARLATAGFVLALAGASPVLADAILHSTLGVPYCAGSGASCDSGTLLERSGHMDPPEANQPNTLGGCLDGSESLRHLKDESVERIVVSTLDGQEMVSGGTVRLEVTFFPYGSGPGNYLQLHYTGDGGNPEAVLQALPTYEPSQGGLQTYTTEYTLPEGSVHRVRARLAGTYYLDACDGYGYYDVDELAFRVAAQADSTEQAVYNPGLGAPKCSAGSPSCDSADLLERSGHMSPPELNQPNTVEGCQDGAESLQHLKDESIERIVVSTVDGQAMTSGSRVRVDVTFFPYGSGPRDDLMISFTSDGDDPAATLQPLLTYEPTRRGLQTQSVEFTLPEGLIHRVRARLADQGHNTDCEGSDYCDVDELVFASQPVDETPPAIYFTPNVDATSVQKSSAVDYPEVTCFDDHDLQPVVSEGAAINTSQAGLYSRTYTCQDSSGNTTSRDFNVSVYESSHGARVEEMYTNITGDSLSADNAQAVSDYADLFESGDLTCTDLVDEFVALADLESSDSYYFECETEETRRSAEILAEICPEGIETCVLSQDHGQLMEIDSFGVTVDRGFLGWKFILGIGADFVPEDPTCLDPNPSVPTTRKCFVDGQSDPSTIHPLQQEFGSDGYIDVTASPKKFEYYNWSYTHGVEKCIDNNPQSIPLCRGVKTDGYTPVLFQAGFSEEELSPGQQRVDALDMGDKRCWQDLGLNWAWTGDNDCYAGWKFDGGISPDRGVRLIDEDHGDWDWGFFEKNSLNFVMSIYDGGSSSDFGLNPCTVLTNSEDWIAYVRNDPEVQPPAPFPDFTDYQPEFVCNFTEEAYSNLMKYKLSEEEREIEAMKQAFFDVASNIATAGIGSGLGAASKAAAAGTRLAKALKAATAAWQTFDTIYSTAGHAAEFYVMGETIIKECRKLTGSNKDACWAQAVLPTLIGLAGDKFISEVSGDLLHGLAKRVPPDSAPETSVDIPTEQTGFEDPGYGKKDFQAFVDNTARRAEIMTGSMTEHHVVWHDLGVDVPGLMTHLKLLGQSQKATELNRVLWEIPPAAKSIDTFVNQLDLRVASARADASEVDSLINYVENWNDLVGLLESGPNRVDRSTIETDLGLHAYLERHADGSDLTTAAQEIEHYKTTIAYRGNTCSL